MHGDVLGDSCNARVKKIISACNIRPTVPYTIIKSAVLSSNCVRREQGEGPRGRNSEETRKRSKGKEGEGGMEEDPVGRVYL